MSDLIEYLTRPQAVEDVRDVVERGCGAYRPMSPFGTGHLYHRAAGAWSALALEPVGERPEAICVYFRPNGEGRYIVTDLGEAVRALRLRTGWFNWHDAIPSGTPDLKPALLTPWGGLWMETTAADLPRAICAVLLAARRVASLQV